MQFRSMIFFLSRQFVLVFLGKMTFGPLTLIFKKINNPNSRFAFNPSSFKSEKISDSDINTLKGQYSAEVV